MSNYFQNESFTNVDYLAEQVPYLNAGNIQVGNVKAGNIMVGSDSNVVTLAANAVQTFVVTFGSPFVVLPSIFLTPNNSNYSASVVSPTSYTGFTYTLRNISEVNQTLDPVDVNYLAVVF